MFCRTLTYILCDTGRAGRCVMTSVGALAAVSAAAWPPLTVARSYATVAVLLLPLMLLLAGQGALVDGHRPQHARRTSAAAAAGDQRGIHDSRVVQDAEYVVSRVHFIITPPRYRAAEYCGSVAEWLACWTQAQYGPWVQIAVATLSGNNLRQTAHTHRASVHQAAKSVACLLYTSPSPRD